MREKIIHMLGGKTKKECRREYLEGNRDMCYQIREKAKDLNGKDSETWCNSMWLYLGTTLDECNDMIAQSHHD